MAAQPLTPEGWTALAPDATSRVIYVSSSQGDDANSGLSPSSPVRSIAAGYDLLRDGFPDWLLLCRGDEWKEPFPNWQKSAGSTSKYMVIGAYGKSPGGARPHIYAGQAAGFDSLSQSPRRGLALTGIHFTSDGTGVSEAAGIEFLDNWGHILIEDCFIERFKDNIVVEPVTPGNRVRDVKIRRCIIVDSYHTGPGHSQGVYLGSCDEWLLEECVLDHNAANKQTIFCHNVYVHQSCGPGVFRGNISSRACSHGVQQRPGGVCENNLMLRNPMSILVGRSQDYPTTANVVRYNVVQDGHDINPNELRAGAIDISDVPQALVELNIVTNQRSGTGNAFGISMTRALNVTVRDNVVYRWTIPGTGVGKALVWSDSSGGVCPVRRNRFQQVDGGMTVAHEFGCAYSPNFAYSGNQYFSLNPLNGYLWFGDVQGFLTNEQWLELTHETGASFNPVSFPDASRTIEKYSKLLGSGGSLESFLTEARRQSRTFWRPEYSAPVVNRWFRVGYAVFCPADFDHNHVLNSLDIAAFMTAFSTNDPRADVNADGVLNILDYVAFNGLLAQGCP